MISAPASRSDIRAAPISAPASAPASAPVSRSATPAAVNGKRPKRKNHDPGPSNREKIQRAHQLQQTFTKVSGKQVWPAGKRCCNKNCSQIVHLTPEQLALKRDPLHSLPDQAARRAYFRSVLLAVASTHSVAQRLLNPPSTLSSRPLAIANMYSSDGCSDSTAAASGDNRNSSAILGPCDSNNSDTGSDSGSDSDSDSGSTSDSGSGDIGSHSGGHDTDSYSGDSGDGSSNCGHGAILTSRITLPVLGREQRVTVNDVSVCLKYFMWVYNVSCTFYYRCLSNYQVHRSKRVDGQAEKLRLVREWFVHFARYHEYMPTDGTIQLPYVNKAQVYEYYKSDMEVAARASTTPAADLRLIACLSYFLKVWSEHESHIVLRRHLSFAICDTCAMLRKSREKRLSEIELVRNTAEFTRHIQLIREERAAYYNKRDRARQQPDKYLSLIMDGSTQYGYSMPHFKYVTKDSMHMEKMKLHVCGVLAHGRGTFMYTITDRWIKGSSFSVEILQRTLTRLEQTRALPPNLYLQLDNTTKENKNNMLFAYLAWLLQREVFQAIEVSFLPVGHTHEDIDQLFSCTSRRLRDRDVKTRKEFERELEMSYRGLMGKPIVGHVDSVIDWKKWLEDNKLYIEMPPFTQYHHFRLERDAERVVRICCKDKYSDKDWKPLRASENTGHAILVPHMPLELPFKQYSNTADIDRCDPDRLRAFGHLSRHHRRAILQLSVPMATPRPIANEADHEKLILQLTTSISKLYNNGCLEPDEHRELLNDITLFDDRACQPLHEVWQQRHGLFRHELDRARHIDAGLGSDDEDEEAESENKLLEARSNQRGYEDSLAYLAPCYLINNVKVGDAVIVAGNDQPVWVAEVVSLDPKPAHGKEPYDIPMLEIVWCKATRLFGVYKQEVHGTWKAKKAPPAQLPNKWQKRDDIIREECYCRFKLTPERRIPVEIIVWIKEHTQLLENWEGKIDDNEELNVDEQKE